MAALLISVMGHDEEVCERDIPAHHPIGILEEGRINRSADSLRGPLIGRDEGAAVQLITRQCINSPLELLDHLIDRRCWSGGGGAGPGGGLPGAPPDEVVPPWRGGRRPSSVSTGAFQGGGTVVRPGTAAEQWAATVVW